MSQEELISEPPKPKSADLSLNIEVSETESKVSRLRRVEDLMKRFVATGAVLLAMGGAAEIGGRVMGIRPEGEKVRLERIDEIEYRDGVLKAEDIRAFLDTMPANWAYGEIASIEGVERSQHDDDKTDIAGEYKASNFRIILDKSDMKESDKMKVFEYLSHEIAHANDFSSDNDLSSADKDSLLIALGDRVRSDERFRSPYVEKLIKEKGFGSDVTKEFWAELCRTYMLDPTALSVEEFQLVDDYVKKNDPNYSWKDSIQKRWDLAYGK